MSAESSKRLESISKRVGELTTAYADLQQRYEKLVQQQQELVDRTKEVEEEAATLRQQKSVELIGKELALSDNFDKVELKQRINEFIKEIDKCVALLNH